MEEMKRLRAVREERGLSQVRLAKLSGVDASTINQAERGKRKPSLTTLERLAAALNTTVIELLSESPDPKAEAQLVTL
jgi:transcriptional regulator with XRE-family HTH domain